MHGQTFDFGSDYCCTCLSCKHLQRGNGQQMQLHYSCELRGPHPPALLILLLALSAYSCDFTIWAAAYSRHLVILLSSTYGLWCFWELFTLLAFYQMEQALERILLVSHSVCPCAAPAVRWVACGIAMEQALERLLLASHSVCPCAASAVRWVTCGIATMGHSMIEMLDATTPLAERRRR